MQVYVKDGLPGRLIAIHYRSITFVRQSSRSRYVTSGGIKAANDGVIVRADIIDGRDVFSRDDQYVRWCFWIDVTKSNSGVGLVNDVRRNITGQYLAEQAILMWLSHVPPLLDGAPAIKRVGQSTTVHVLEFTTQWDTMGDATRGDLRP